MRRTIAEALANLFARRLSFTVGTLPIRYEREVSAGLISKVEYRMKVYGEDEEVARQKIEEIKTNEPTIKDLLGE